MSFAVHRESQKPYFFLSIKSENKIGIGYPSTHRHSPRRFETVTDGVFGHNVAVKWKENDNGFTAIIFLGLPLQSTTESTIITKFVSRGIHDTNVMMMEKFLIPLMTC